MNLRELAALWSGAILLGLVCLVLLGGALAADLGEVEQGVGFALGEMVVGLLAALGIGAGGMKGVDTYRAKRNGAENGQSNGVTRHRVGAVEEAIGVVHTRIDKVKDEQSLMRAQLTEIASNVSYLRGKAEAA